MEVAPLLKLNYQEASEFYSLLTKTVNKNTFSTMDLIRFIDQIRTDGFRATALWDKEQLHAEQAKLQQKKEDYRIAFTKITRSTQTFKQFLK